MLQSLQRARVECEFFFLARTIRCSETIRKYEAVDFYGFNDEDDLT